MDDSIRAGEKTIGGLQFKPLPLAFLIVNGYSLNSHCLDGFDSVQFAHPILLGQQGIAVFTTIEQCLRITGRTQMAVSALAADEGGNSGQSAISGDVISVAHIQLCANYAVHAALMVDEAAWPEF